MVEFMRNSDAFALGMEQDARLRSTIVTIILLDRSPDWAVLLDRFERIVRLMPMVAPLSCAGVLISGRVKRMYGVGPKVPKMTSLAPWEAA